MNRFAEKAVILGIEVGVYLMFGKGFGKYIHTVFP